MNTMQETSEHASYVHGNTLIPVRADALDPTDRFCCICLQPFGPAALAGGGSEIPCQLPCGHVFGEACIGSWILTDNSCPLCRGRVFSFGIDDRSTSQDFSTDRIVINLSSALTPQDDIWLDEFVWNSSTYHCQTSVSDTDIDTLVYTYTSVHSHPSFDSQPESILRLCLCGDHRGFCQCSGFEDLEDATAHRGPTQLAASAIRHTGIEDLDLVRLGAQFADLDCQHRLWMDEFFEEPTFCELSC